MALRRPPPSLPRFFSSIASLKRPPSRHHNLISHSQAFNDDLLLASLQQDAESRSKDAASVEQIAPLGSLKPFELVLKPGTKGLSLRRAFGVEQITVNCLLEAEFPEYEEQQSVRDNQLEPPVQQNLYMHVRITKGTDTPRVEMICSYNKDKAQDVVIENVSYSDKPSSDGVSRYLGPYFWEMDENIQQAFHDAMKARGITAKLANSVVGLFTAKYGGEYIRWAQNVQSFIRK